MQFVTQDVLKASVRLAGGLVAVLPTPTLTLTLTLTQVRALLSAGAVCISYNLRGYVPLHSAIAAGKKESLEQLIAFHEKRRLEWATLCAQNSNDSPLHIAVRQLRIPLFMWMVEHGGFSAGLVMKNVENSDPMKHLKKAQGLLKKMAKFRKKELKALK